VAELGLEFCFEQAVERRTASAKKDRINLSAEADIWVNAIVRRDVGCGKRMLRRGGSGDGDDGWGQEGD
jgi:hypothetical protein